MNPILSMTRNATSTDCKDTRAGDVVEAIRTGKWREPVEHIRARYAEVLAATNDPHAAKDAVNELKKRLPGVLPSGNFSRRCIAGLVAHSGLICADFDYLEPAQQTELRLKLANDPHVFAFFHSPTGTGLKVWFRVPADASLHAASFAAVQRRCRELYNVEIDPACKDLARLCFVSSDPEAFLNRDAVELAPLAESSIVTPPRSAPRAPSVNGNGLPPSADRLLATGAPAGERNAQAFKLACQLRDTGLTESEAKARILEFAARCSPTLSTREALACLRSAYATPPREPARGVSAPRLKIGNAASEYISTAASTAKSADEETFVHLATLLPAEYDRCREAEAEKLKIRVGTLDAEVAKRRPQGGGSVQGGTVDFPDVTSWPQPVDGAEVLAAVAKTFAHYVALPKHAADALALWVAHAHAFEAFVHSPRLNLCSPEKQCGKTLLEDVTAALVPRPLRTESITPAVLFRLVELHKPVLLLDEIDTYLHDADELRGLLNAGHKRGAKAYRCEGDRNEVRGFAAFAPAVLAGIGTLPGTLHDRSIVIRLTRAKPGEVAARFDSRRTATEAELCRKLARWTADHRSHLETLDPALPESAFNRLADNWRPLFAIAQTAGSDWPDRVAAAFTALTSGDDLDAHGIGAALLADIRAIFTAAKADRLPSAKIAEELAGMDGKPWPEFGKLGKPITPNQLAKLLRRFEIHSRNLKLPEEKVAKGYLEGDFQEAWTRYLPQQGETSRYPATKPANIGDSSLSETLPFKVGSGCETAQKPCVYAGSSGVADEKGGCAEPAGFWPDGSPITEPPADLPPVDAGGQRIETALVEETITV